MEITATESSSQTTRLDLSVPSLMSRYRFWKPHKNPSYLSSTGGRKNNSSRSGDCYRLLQHGKTKKNPHIYF